MEIVSAILALIKAIPILDQWFKQLALAHGKWKLETFDKEFTKAMAVLIAEKDQRLIEEVLGMRPGPSLDQEDVVRRRREDRPT
jgi:hypothetical protein